MYIFNVAWLFLQAVNTSPCETNEFLVNKGDSDLKVRMMLLIYIITRRLLLFDSCWSNCFQLH